MFAKANARHPQFVSALLKGARPRPLACRSPSARATTQRRRLGARARPEGLHSADAATPPARAAGYQGPLVRVSCLFPDPWDQQRFRRRRLLQPELVALLAEALAEGGEMVVASDNLELAREMRAHLVRVGRQTVLRSNTRIDLTCRHQRGPPAAAAG